MSPNTPSKRRHYLMALFGRRRVPIRVAKAKADSAKLTAREWWEVEAISALAARKLCLGWPQICVAKDARITSHGRNRN
jgi:hypothetical protein